MDVEALTLTGRPHHVPYCLDVRIHVREVHASIAKLPLRECPGCGDDTSQPTGECDLCTGSIRPACRVCQQEAPEALWSEQDTPGNHKVPNGSMKGRWCPGTAFPVTVLQ